MDFTELNFQSNISIFLERLKEIASSLKAKNEIELSKKIEDIFYLLDDVEATESIEDTITSKDYSNNNNELIDFLYTFSKDSSKLQARNTLRNVSKFISTKRQSEVMSLNTKQTLFDVNSIIISVNIDKITTFDYDIFELEAIVKQNLLVILAKSILNQVDIYINQYFKESHFFNFLEEIRKGYNNTPYHNYIHAGDVFQTSYVFFHKGTLIQDLNLNQIDILSFFIGCICHDYKHDGFNNTYHQNRMTDIAIDSNNVSILENYHARESFKVILKSNLLSELDKDSFYHFRKRFLEVILSTDMVNHSSLFSNLKNKIQIYDVDLKTVNRLISKDSNLFENQQLILNMLIHSADISNPAKPFTIYRKWVDFIFLEFFHQGDEEKRLGLDVTILCDRTTTSISKSQINFISYVVLPNFELLKRIVDVSGYIENMKSNFKYYLQVEEERNK